MIRARLQLLDSVPAVVSTSYYPLWLAAGTRLESPDALPEGPDNLIEDLGHVFARGVELLTARMPIPEETRLLELDPACRWRGCCTSTTTRTAGRSRSPTTCTPGTGTSSRSSGPAGAALRWVSGRLMGRADPRVGCEMCENARPKRTSTVRASYRGRYTDAYLQRADVQRGYTLVIWRGRHVNEPTELDEARRPGTGPKCSPWPALCSGCIGR